MVLHYRLSKSAPQTIDGHFGGGGNYLIDILNFGISIKIVIELKNYLT